MLFLFKGFLIVLALTIASCTDDSTCPSTSKREAKKAEVSLADFGFTLFKSLAAQDETKNQVISPVGLGLGLALLESGADGQTRQQIKKALLGSGASSGDVLSVFTSLADQLKMEEGEKTTLEFANGLFQDKDLKLKDDYLKSVKNCFKAEVDQVDFKQELEQARQKVNQFVSEKTLQKVPELYKKGALTTSDQLVLANALYFNASWNTAFKQVLTDTFYSNGQDEKTQSVPFVQVQASFRHISKTDYDALALPYQNQDYAFYVVLPKKRDGLVEVEKQLTARELGNVVLFMRRKEVNVQVPKFQTRSSIDLKDTLSKLGLESVFGQSADYRRLSDAAVKIGSGVHEAYISVDQHGTEGAAATSFAGGKQVEEPLSQDAVQFKVDHPFLYAIMHRTTGAVIFLGKVNSIEQ